MNNIHTEFASLHLNKVDAARLLNDIPSGMLVDAYSKPTRFTPKIDPSYVFPEVVRDLLVWFMDSTDPLYIVGPTGCGKTSCIKQLAARLRYPVFEMTGHGRLEFADLVGHLSVKDGTMTFEYGPLALAMLYGGLFLLNEVDLTPPDVAAGLNGVLDGSPLCIPENEGELIQPNAGFRFAATANTNGGGDESGLYQGTQRQNLSFADRFMFCEMGYPVPEVEENLLELKFPQLPRELRKNMVRFANEVRRLFMGEDGNGDITDCLEVTFSTRSLLRWADLTLKFQLLGKHDRPPVTYALDRALGYRASRTGRALLLELAQRIFQQAMGSPREEDSQEEPLYTSTGGIHYLDRLLAGHSPGMRAIIALRKEVQDAHGRHTKEWIGEAQPRGLKMQFGRTGRAKQARFCELADCCQNNPLLELKNRVTRKLLEGYWIVPELSGL